MKGFAASDVAKKQTKKKKSQSERIKSFAVLRDQCSSV